MRAFEVGCYGNTHVRTPHIDSLAKRGTRFDLAVTNNPVCTPARSCMLSGQYSRTCTGMLGNVHRNPPTPTRGRLVDPTLPETLREAGYRTALIGKWHIDPQPQLVGFDSALYPMVAHRNHGQTYFNERAERFAVNGFGPQWELEQVQTFLRQQQDTDRPFFLMYNISPPHQPIGPGHLPDEFTSMYDPATVPLRPNVPDREETERDRWWFSVYASADFFWRELRNEEQDPRDIVPDDFHMRDLVALYYGACTFTDHLVGELMTALDANGLANNTIVLFTSDHGDNLGSHGMFNKGALIEEALRVPFIVADPRRAPAENDGQIAALIDIMPTLLDLAGCAIPATVQGQSLAPLVGGGQNVLDGNVAFIETGNMIGVRTPSHLYGTGFAEADRAPRAGKAWLYDLDADPFELKNLAGESAVEADLRRQLLEWDKETPWLGNGPPDPGGAYADQLVERDRMEKPT